MDTAGLHRLCDGEQYHADEVATAETHGYGGTEGCQGGTAADSERIDKPESGLSALEGFGYVVCDQRHREYEGGQDLL